MAENMKEPDDVFSLASPWREAHRYHSIDSTQRSAARGVAAGEDLAGVVLWAESQTDGHGRQGRGWDSSVGGLYVTAILPEDIPIEDSRLGWIPLLGALACVELLRKNYGVLAILKWPNDVLIDGQKVAGFLGEVQRFANTGGEPRRQMLIGFGLNWLNEIDQAAQSGGFSATRVADHVEGLTLEARRDFLENWLAQFGGYLEEMAREPNQAIERFRVLSERRLWRRGSIVKLEQTEAGMVRGILLGIGGTGAARLQLEEEKIVEVQCGSQAPEPPMPMDNANRNDLGEGSGFENWNIF